MKEPFVETKASPKTPKYEMIGHCGRMFKEFEICEELGRGLDDLCTGCCMNEEETDECEDEDES